MVVCIYRHDLAALGAQSSCEQALRTSSAVRAAVPRIDAILDDCKWKVRELLALPAATAAALPTPPASLGVDRLLALVAYTHELQRVGGVRAGNLHHELNQVRRAHTATAYHGSAAYRTRGLQPTVYMGVQPTAHGDAAYRV